MKGLTEKPLSWVPNPARFIPLNEFPPLPWAVTGPPYTWAIWQFCRGPSTVHSAADIHQKVFSAILFVDGHAKLHDFTQTVKSNWPAEETAEWIWYKPKRQ